MKVTIHIDDEQISAIVIKDLLDTLAAISEDYARLYPHGGEKNLYGMARDIDAIERVLEMYGWNQTHTP